MKLRDPLRKDESKKPLSGCLPHVYIEQGAGPDTWSWKWTQKKKGIREAGGKTLFSPDAVLRYANKEKKNLV